MKALENSIIEKDLDGMSEYPDADVAQWTADREMLRASRAGKKWGKAFVRLAAAARGVAAAASP